MATVDEIRRKWGTDAEYYKENELFHKKHHGGADYIEYDNETGVPVRAVYIFKPWQVWLEHQALILRLQQVYKEPNETD